MKTYTSRFDFFEPEISGRRVLDIGPAELVGTVNRDKLDRWLHGRMAGLAESIVGVEASSEQVAALSDLGYDIRHGDAQTFELGESYERVVAGELIEHLSNPGAFLDRVHRHLAPDGKLLLTTPNRFSILAGYFVFKTGRVPRYEKDLAKHVMYFDSDSLGSLLERHHFAVEKVSYCRWVGAPSRRLASRMLVGMAARWRPALLPTLLISATPVAKEPR